MAGYETGKTMRELSVELGIHRNTVSSYLRRTSARLRRPGLDPTQARTVADLYQAGWSSGRLAEMFEVSADTVLKALRQSGTPIRPRRGGPRPSHRHPDNPTDQPGRRRQEIHATGGDIRRICDLFGLSVEAATRYAL